MAHPVRRSKASTRQQNNRVFGLCARSTIRRHGTRPGTERYRSHDDSLSAPGQFALWQAHQYRSNRNRSMVGRLSFSETFCCLWRLPQPDARAFPVLLDEDHAGRFEGGALHRPIASSPRAAPAIARSCLAESPRQFFKQGVGFRSDALTRPARMYGGSLSRLGMLSVESETLWSHRGYGIRNWDQQSCHRRHVPRRCIAPGLCPVTQ